MTTGIWTRKNLNPTRRSRNAKVQSGTQYTNGNLYRRNSPILKEYTLSSTYLEKKLLAKCENEGSQLAELCCVRKYRRTGKSSLSQSTRKNANPMQMQDPVQAATRNSNTRMGALVQQKYDNKPVAAVHLQNLYTFKSNVEKFRKSDFPTYVIKKNKRASVFPAHILSC